MKRLKLMLVSTVILLAIGTAFATRPCQNCIYSDQYIWNGSSFQYAGEYGFDYYCLQYGGTCTYYKPFPFTHPDSYYPCRSGVYTLIP